MASCRDSSQSIAAYTSPVAACSMPRVGPRVVSGHQARVDSFEPGDTTREMTRASARSRCGPAWAEQGGHAELAGHRVDGGDVAVRQRPGDRDPGVPGRGEGLALQRGLDRVDHVAGQPRQVRERLVPHPRAVAVGAAQQPRLVLAPLPLLIGMRTPDPGHVHRSPRLLQHDRIVTACSLEHPATRQDFPGYTMRPPGGSPAWSGTRFLLGDPATSWFNGLATVLATVTASWR